MDSVSEPERTSTAPSVVEAFAIAIDPQSMSSCGKAMARRLLTKPEMQKVWLALRRAPANPDSLAAFERQLARGGQPNPSLQDQACAWFFVRAMYAFGGMVSSPNEGASELGRTISFRGSLVPR
jgi:hypothetical protein